MRSPGLPLLLALALAPRFLLACEPSKVPAPPTPARRAVAPEGAAPAPAAPRAPGQVAFVDLTTGRLVEPSPEDAARLAADAALQRATSTSHEGLVEERLPDGTVLIDLQGRFQSALVATVGPDGKLRMGHPSPAPAGPPDAKANGAPGRKP